MFFIFKIIIRHLKLGGKIIFVDESTFYTKNLSFKTWRKRTDYVYNNFIDIGKRNLFLAASNDKIIHWEITSENSDAQMFKNFI